MPTTIHERFTEQVSDFIKGQLKCIKSGNDEAARFAGQILSVRSGSIRLKEFDSDDDIEIDQAYIQRQPDDQFQHKDAEYPGVVIKTGVTQNTKELRRRGLISNTLMRISRQLWVSIWVMVKKRKPEYQCGSRDICKGLRRV
jgi:hypothetical protein